jgi:hypothetical protein
VLSLQGVQRCWRWHLPCSLHTSRTLTLDSTIVRSPSLFRSWWMSHWNSSSVFSWGFAAFQCLRRSFWRAWWSWISTCWRHSYTSWTKTQTSPSHHGTIWTGTSSVWLTATWCPSSI